MHKEAHKLPHARAAGLILPYKTPANSDKQKEPLAHSLDAHVGWARRTGLDVLSTRASYGAKKKRPINRTGLLYPTRLNSENAESRPRGDGPRRGRTSGLELILSLAGLATRARTCGS